jgi:hypothetical protein
VEEDYDDCEVMELLVGGPPINQSINQMTIPSQAGEEDEGFEAHVESTYSEEPLMEDLAPRSCQFVYFLFAQENKQCSVLPWPAGPVSRQAGP